MTDQTKENKVRGWCDSLISPDPNWKRVYILHQRTRMHSYANLCWLLISSSLLVFFLRYKFRIETDLKCLAAQSLHDPSKYLIFSSFKDIISSD